MPPARSARGPGSSAAGPSLRAGEKLPELRIGHRGQASLRVLGEARKNHGDMIARVFIAGAGNYNAGAMEPAADTRRLQSHRHLRPCREGRGTAKFDTILMDDD